MSATFNQNNNNYGSGTQNNYQNSYQSDSATQLNRLIEQLKTQKGSSTPEIENQVDDLIQTIEATPNDEFSTPKFVSKISSLFTSLPSMISQLTNTSKSTESLLSTISGIKDIIEGFWK